MIGWVRNKEKTNENDQKSDTMDPSKVRKKRRTEKVINK